MPPETVVLVITERQAASRDGPRVPPPPPPPSSAVSGPMQPAAGLLFAVVREFALVFGKRMRTPSSLPEVSNRRLPQQQDLGQ